MKINLNDARPGQKLRSKHGAILTYIERLNDCHYPHYVEYPSGGRGTRTDDGKVYREERYSLETDHDIVEILPMKNENPPAILGAYYKREGKNTIYRLISLEFEYVLVCVNGDASYWRKPENRIVDVFGPAHSKGFTLLDNVEIKNENPPPQTVEALRKAGYKVAVYHFRFCKLHDNLVGEYNFLESGFSGEDLSGHGGETHVVITTPEGKNLIGVAKCSKKDNFNRKFGTALAIKRALEKENEY